MNLFRGSSFFGMGVGAKKPGRARRSFESQAGAQNADEEAEVSCAATESEPGELVRRKQHQSEPSWTKRGLFKAGFNTGAPRLRSARKFTK